MHGTGRFDQFLAYHTASMNIGDVDPQNACLRYLANRYELNEEQRYWLAFLFGCTYCAPTVFYIYNEFPDFENVDVARLSRWWSENRHRCLFQTDRLRIKTQNLLVETFESYRRLVGGRTQEQAFYDAAGARGVGSRRDMYRAAWDFAGQIRNFGRFTLFIHLELVHELTNYKMAPDELDVKNALSSRNGLLYVLGRDEWIDKPMNRTELRALETVFQNLLRLVQTYVPATTAWSLETILCAFKKHCRKDRWVGYYLDRQHREILKLQEAVPAGVDWSVLWDYRAETYYSGHLIEVTGKPSSLEAPYEWKG